MYTDTCRIYSVTTDKQFGAKTETSEPSVCRLEDTDRTERAANGEMIMYDTLFILPPSAAIKEGDEIAALTVRGVAVTLVKKKVSKVFPIGGMFPHHAEVYTK